MAVTVTARRSVEKIGLFGLPDGSELDEVLASVAFERAGEIVLCAGGSIRWFCHVCDIPSGNAVPVFCQESNKRDSSGDQCVVKEFTVVEVFVCNQKKITSSADGRQAFEDHKAEKNWSGSSVGWSTSTWTK